MKVYIPSKKDSHALEWACEWHIQDLKKKKKKAGHVPGQLLCRKEPQSCDGRVLRILRNDAEKLRLEENVKTPCTVES